MMILLTASNKDTASLNIAKQIHSLNLFQKKDAAYQENPIYTAEINGNQVFFITLNEESVNAQQLPIDFPEAKLIVFISRHSSQTEKPTLTVHTPGNFDKAEYGGLPQTLSVSPAIAMQAALKTLLHYKQELNLDYEVSYEATHHGPSLEIPAMFVELGSCEKQWSNTKAALAVAYAAISAVTSFKQASNSAALGIGGPHYNQKFTELALADKAVFGHMIPKYALSQVDFKMLMQCINKTHEKISHAILDWKGIQSKDKPNLMKVLKDINLNYAKI